MRKKKKEKKHADIQTFLSRGTRTCCHVTRESTQ